MDPSPRELELTPDLLEYVKAVALKEAQKRCPRYVDFDDVIQFAMLQLLRRPPKFDPSRGASPKTLIYTIVHRAVIKYAELEAKQGRRFRQSSEPTEASRGGEDIEPAHHGMSERRTTELTNPSPPGHPGAYTRNQISYQYSGPTSRPGAWRIWPKVDATRRCGR